MAVRLSWWRRRRRRWSLLLYMTTRAKIPWQKATGEIFSPALFQAGGKGMKQKKEEKEGEERTYSICQKKKRRAFEEKRPKETCSGFPRFLFLFNFFAEKGREGKKPTTAAWESGRETERNKWRERHLSVSFFANFGKWRKKILWKKKETLPPPKRRHFAPLLFFLRFQTPHYISLKRKTTKKYGASTPFFFFPSNRQQIRLNTVIIPFLPPFSTM